MKRCPECRRDYYDDSLSYCLDDGAALLDGPSAIDDPPTAILAAGTSGNESATKPFVSETNSRIRGFDRRWLAVPLVLAVLAVGGFVGYRFFQRDTGQVESIAVMPFVNESGSSDLEYFSDGITESLINSLSQLPNVRVIARSSAFRYKGKSIDLQQVAKELGVQAVLNGRVVQRGDTLSINVDLMNAGSNTQLWGQQFTRKLSDVFALQDEIARKVTDSLRVRLTNTQRAQLTKRYTENEEAYRLYLQGRYHWNKRYGSLRKAVEYFQQAIDKDPTYGLAYAGLAETYALLGEYDVEDPKTAAPKGKGAASKALELDPELAEAYTALAYIKADFDWDFPGAEKDYLKAIELNPRYATARQWYGEYLAQMGRFDEAEVQVKQAQEFDPLSPVINQQMAAIFMFQRQPDRAIEVCRKTIELDPNFANAYGDLGWVFEEKKLYAEAIAAYSKRSLLLGADPHTISSREDAFNKGGWTAYLGKILETQLEQKTSPGSIASTYAQLGQYDEALDWLERSYEAREDAMAWINVSAEYQPMRSNPRFQQLLRKVGFPGD
ncbi:MAG TPA: tetratricopeptide repeat protein [Pyrinomonadaceae bacterium]|nr:tetratricopeptide repeat protein [Pyrinomonadaceae bacterium]